MDTNTQGATGTAAGQSAGAGSPTATAGQQSGAATGTAQAAAPSGAGNQSTGNAAAGQSSAGQTVPLQVVTQLREKNRQLEAQMAQALQQNQAILDELQQARASRQVSIESNDPLSALAEVDRPMVKTISHLVRQEIGQELKPLLERFGNVSRIVEMQDHQQRLERKRAAWDRIASQNPIYSHKLLGAGAKADLESKIAQYDSLKIQFNAFEVAEEVAAKWNAARAEYDTEVAQALVADSRRAAPGAGTGAAVTSGQSGPVTTPGQGFVGLKAKSEQFKAELLRQRAAGAGAA